MLRRLAASALLSACATPATVDGVADGARPPLVVTACVPSHDDDAGYAFVVDASRRAFVAASTPVGSARKAAHALHAAAAARRPDAFAAATASLGADAANVEGIAASFDDGERATLSWSGGAAAWIVRGGRAFLVAAPHTALAGYEHTTMTPRVRARLAATPTRFLDEGVDTVTVALWPGQQLVLATPAAPIVAGAVDVDGDAAALLDALVASSGSGAVVVIDVGGDLPVDDARCATSVAY